MSKQIEFESTVGPNDFPVIVRVSVTYERADRECGPLTSGWIAEIDEVEPDKDRMAHGETVDMMPEPTPSEIEYWECKAAEIAEDNARSFDAEDHDRE